MASSTKAENKGFLEHVKDFPPIIDGKINAVKFVEATLGLLWVVGKWSHRIIFYWQNLFCKDNEKTCLSMDLSSTRIMRFHIPVSKESLGKLFAPVKYDMEGNINKIKKLDFKYGSCLLESALKECSQGKPVATEGLLWLNRSLCFFEIVFQEMLISLKDNNMDVNMKKIYVIAYEGSVKRYHSKITQQIFSLICRLAPTLHQLLKSFGVDDNIESFRSRLTSFNITLHLVRCKIDDFYRDNNLFC